MEWYRGESGGKKRPKPAELPGSLVERHTNPAGYRADRGLADAVNVALFLGQPLLLTGQPGTGKTQLAYSLAWELGFELPLKFETKSTSVARDLFYTYDTLGRFSAVQLEKEWRDPVQYIRFNALGLAILYGNDPREAKKFLGDDHHVEPRRSVVLIDEIDKAPRDFPNDLLNEIEHMYFRIPELGNVKVESQASTRPVLVLTSNSEKNLPEAFLRRCIFYDIPFPDPERLHQIIYARLGETIVKDEALLKDAMEIFSRLRSRSSGLLKLPSTSELLAWFEVLLARNSVEGLPTRDNSMVEPALSSLIKTAEDRPKAREVLQEWLRSQKR